MGSNFASTVDQWHDFYVMAGTISATLVGLLFVSVSLHADLLADPNAAGVLASARRAFRSFLLVVLIALIFVIPAQSPQGLGIPLLCFSVANIVRMVHVTRVIQREHTHLISLLGSASELGRLGIGVVSSVGLLIVPCTILAGSTAGLDWLVGVIGVILVGGADNSWRLLLDLATAKRRIAAQKAPPAGAATLEAVE